MRICYFADGESIHVVRWCNYFASLGHDVHLISFKKVTIENVTTHFIDSGDISVSGGNWQVLLKYRKVKALLKELRPTVFHSHYATSYGITGALCNYHPYVITCLGTDVLISAQQSRLYKLLLRFAFSRADRINSLAPHMTSAIQKIGVDMSKVVLIPFGIDLEIFNDNKRNTSSTKFVITSNRNHESVYNIPHLLKAIAKVKPFIPNIEFVITGDGSLRKELEQMTIDLGIDDISIFLGKIPQTEMVKLLNKTHVFVSVSLSDGNSLSLLEAMACGTYPIVTDIFANREWVMDGLNGSFIKIDDVQGLADEILKVYLNFDNIIEKATSESRKIISEKGSWNINMTKIENIYKELSSNG